MKFYKFLAKWDFFVLSFFQEDFYFYNRIYFKNSELCDFDKIGKLRKN